jgi:hypothetical protein
MQAIAFVIETLAHFMRQSGPAPGISAHADAEFEHELAWLCEWHSLTPIVLASLENLALRPRLSRVALGRLTALANASRAASSDLRATATALAAAFESRVVDYMFLGDMVVADTVYPEKDVRPIEWLEVMVRESDYVSAVHACREVGFRTSERAPKFRDGNEALRYHQYYASCVMQSGGGDRLGLRMRLFDVGEPEPTEAAWGRARRVGAVFNLRTVGIEDQLIHSCITYNMTDFDKLLHAADIGLMLTRCERDLDWDYIEARLRPRWVYPSVFFTLRNVIQWLSLQRASCKLADPWPHRRRIFETVWHVDYNSFAMRRPKRCHRFRFGLFEIGGWDEKRRFLVALLSPSREWVADFFGRPYQPWLRLKFIVLALRNRIGLLPAVNPSPGNPSPRSPSRRV